VYTNLPRHGTPCNHVSVASPIIGAAMGVSVGWGGGGVVQHNRTTTRFLLYLPVTRRVLAGLVPKAPYDTTSYSPGPGKDELPALFKCSWRTPKVIGRVPAVDGGMYSAPGVSATAGLDHALGCVVTSIVRSRWGRGGGKGGGGRQGGEQPST
jgi:hypothetical protein